VRRDYPYDPITDFVPFSLVARQPSVLAVSPDVPARDVAELLAWLRARGDAANYGSTFPGATNHLAGELLKHLARLDFTIVPYRTAALAVQDLVALGCHHEEQHQELLITDILHLFAQNPLDPAVFTGSPPSVPTVMPSPVEWIAGPTGRIEIGHEGNGFAFDCEGPRHSVWLAPYALADRMVTNAEWRAFVADGGYARPEFWLADGWAWVQAEQITAPLYWRGDGMAFGLDGLHPIDWAAPVAHVSQYEADAFARWAGARLPTEAEWEALGATCDPLGGNQLDTANAPRPHAASGTGLRQMFGDVWQWTASAYLPYPGFRVAAGAVGEYNGKFMSGQMVLRGASCATPRGSSRATVRNFFPPHTRWQFAGVRLARDA